MQIRYATDLSAEEYVRQEAWRKARLDGCPLHPEGGCGLCRHGTYERKHPEGTRIARWYCAPGHTTFGLLPDCFCSQLSGTLLEVEQCVRAVEQAPSQETALEKIRTEIDLPGALRWVRRRLFFVEVTLSLLSIHLPSVFGDARPSLASFGQVLDTEVVLPLLRHVARDHINTLPAPLGFGPLPRKRAFQQSTGTDPPGRRV